MIPVMNGHSSTPSPSPIPPNPLIAAAAHNPWSAAMLVLAGMLLGQCGPVMSWTSRFIESLRCENKPCTPPCKPNEVCANGTCANVAAERNMTLASDNDSLPRLIFEIRASTVK